MHPFLEYVHDWADFFSECIYENVEGITTAREFILRKRDDGGVWRLRYVTNDALLLLQLPPPQRMTILTITQMCVPVCSSRATDGRRHRISRTLRRCQGPRGGSVGPLRSRRSPRQARSLQASTIAAAVTSA